jgi:hypothetical protein
MCKQSVAVPSAFVRVQPPTSSDVVVMFVKGSKAHVRAAKSHFRFTPECGPARRKNRCWLWASGGYLEWFNSKTDRELRSKLCALVIIKVQVEIAVYSRMTGNLRLERQIDSYFFI